MAFVPRPQPALCQYATAAGVAEISWTLAIAEHITTPSYHHPQVDTARLRQERAAGYAHFLKVGGGDAID